MRKRLQRSFPQRIRICLHPIPSYVGSVMNLRTSYSINNNEIKPVLYTRLSQIISKHHINFARYRCKTVTKARKGDTNFGFLCPVNLNVKRN